MKWPISNGKLAPKFWVGAHKFRVGAPKFGIGIGIGHLFLKKFTAHFCKYFW